jgi:transcriptional regulator with XRE-family HTH domain
MTMRLKELRLQKGVTQQEVARAIGCSANNYARYERGEREPDIATLCSFADYFRVSVDSVIGYSNKRKNKN